VNDRAKAVEKLSTTCCIVGGGPAGMMLALLLARAGIDVVVLEKHGDFLRDFRGDTIHPSTLEVMHELGLLDELLKLPHQKAATLRGWVGDLLLTVADFSHLPTRCGFIAFMPQWDFLNFLAREASRYATFVLRMQAAVTDVIEETGHVVGVRAALSNGALEVRADLVIGADGRHSVIREKSGLVVDDLGAPMDVLWFSVSRRPTDPSETTGRFDTGRIFIAINRGDQWQCGFVIPKDSIVEVQARGLPAFRADVAALAPYVADRVEQIRDWEQVKLLTVCVDRLRQWSRPGLLCIGDAAHAMSPIGGVGINLAIQDAVAAANLLATPLRERHLSDEHLQRVQRRRELPTRLIQWIQLLVQNRVVTRVLAGTGRISPPLAVRLLARFPVLSRIPARMVGMGARPEHVRTPTTSKNPAA
jgi:2-polyprenyl-6-methoxyphenol hydroxylase-like FAD-dependent oxidoreductase